MMSKPTELITIGRIVKPFGVKGEVHVQSLTDVPGRFEELGEVTLVLSSGHRVVTTVTKVRGDGQFYRVSFASCTTPEEAASFRGALVKIPEGQAPLLPAGQHYQYELIGLTVQDEAGRSLGVLEEVLEMPEQQLFVVRRGNREILIPAVRAMITKIDIENHVMIVSPVEGLLGDHDAV